MHRFDELTRATPAAWSGGGLDGGWTTREPSRSLSASRPPGHSFLGNHGEKTTSWMEREFVWPAPSRNLLGFEYFVDSEPTHDVLVLSVDGTPVWKAGGRRQSEHTVVPMPQGAHRIRFEYSKNESVDAGLDTARVDNIVAYSGGTPRQAHDFSGRVLDTAPMVPGAIEPDWKTGGTGRGWVVTDITPPNAYTPLQTVGAKYDPTWKTFIEPTIDGLIASDYINPTRVSLLNYAELSAPAGSLRIVASDSSDSLVIGLRTPAGTAAIGDEAGELTIYLDDDRLESLSDRGCAGDRHAPGPRDRRVQIHYTAAPSEGTLQVDPPLQQVGDCAGGFQPLSSETPWQIEVAASEPQGDPGFLHFEVELTPPDDTAALSDLSLGFGLIQESSSGSPSRLRFPFPDDGSGPLPDDVHSWATLNLSYSHGEPDLSENVMDAVCCFPAPSRLAIDW